MIMRTLAACGAVLLCIALIVAADAAFADPTIATKAISTSCPLIRTPRGTLQAEYVADYHQSGADACILRPVAEVPLRTVPHNFCPNGGRYTVRKVGTDVCAIAAADN